MTCRKVVQAVTEAAYSGNRGEHPQTCLVTEAYSSSKNKQQKKRATEVEACCKIVQAVAEVTAAAESNNSRHMRW
eukprot:CAMPEP_0194281998 /NCGR_PEP_ID=MMETSP0169-20130528/22129_1 /TAXON_ID=218684 /ORGANISM="Corethron pennatum, Strain L29A3" /LENGTH=74 /DNA_ID=CAMNT_0039027203 /DNA_START=908 /DNA_END=1129 /DNA_ORIENTATION=+